MYKYKYDMTAKCSRINTQLSKVKLATLVEGCQKAPF